MWAMSLQELIAIADGAMPTPAGVVNVRTRDDCEPLMRELTSVKIEQRRSHGLSERWLVWRWIPSGSTPEGKPDCGYAGMVEVYARAGGVR